LAAHHNRLHAAYTLLFGNKPSTTLASSAAAAAALLPLASTPDLLSGSSCRQLTAQGQVPRLKHALSTQVQHLLLLLLPQQ
jgi:hypothetical protein